MKKYKIRFLHILFRSSVLVAMLMVILSSCATTGNGSDMSLQEAIKQSAERIVADIPKGSIVAIAAFETDNEHLSDYILKELNGALVDRGIIVVSRQSLQYVERELNFQMSGAVSDKTAQSIGKFFGAGIIIIGEITNVGKTYRYRVDIIHVEEARYGSSIRFDIQNDRATRRMIDAIAKQKTSTTQKITERTEPNSALDFLEHGIVLAMRGEYDLAIENFNDALELNQDLIGAYMLRGRALYASVSYVYSTDDNFTGVGLIIGEDEVSAEKKKTYDLAIKDFTQAIKLSPNLANAYIERGVVYLNLGDYDRALMEFNQAIRFDPNSHFAYHERGLTYYKRNEIGDLDRAIIDNTQAIKLDLDSAMTYRNRGQAYYDRNKGGDLDLAIADFTEAIRLKPNDVWYPWVYQERGLAYSKRNNKGDLNRAIADYTQAIKLDPNYKWAYINRGQAYYKRNNRDDYNRAIVDFTEAIKLDPNIALAYNERGLVYSKHNNKGDLNRAISDYTQAITLSPNNAVHYNNRGWAYNDRNNSGDNDHAMADFTEAVRLDPNYTYAYNGRGWAYFNKRDYDRAIADFTEAIRLDPNYTYAYNGRGVAYFYKEDFERAIADYETALRIDPQNANAGQWRKNIRLARRR